MLLALFLLTLFPTQGDKLSTFGQSEHHLAVLVKAKELSPVILNLARVIRRDPPPIRPPNVGGVIRCRLLRLWGRCGRKRRLRMDGMDGRRDRTYLLWNNGCLSGENRRELVSDALVSLLERVG